jgi:ubiquinol-cytochrome c reductase cytochrome c1 subunit
VKALYSVRFLNKYLNAFLVAIFVSSMLVNTGVIASSGAHLDKANIKLEDSGAIKRGAKLFVQYCLNCHSASLMRYSRIAADMGMTDEEITEQFITTGAKVGDTMTITMEPADAKQWFGTAVPDLSVISRARGDDWLYTYLRSFYRDESRPWGVNNAVFKDVGMPHVLWELQGLQEAQRTTIVNEEGMEQEVISGFKLIEPGKLSPQEYDAAILDLVSFLAYLGEPSKLQRQALGKWVLLFLAGFLVIVYLLKKEYWKDIH